MFGLFRKREPARWELRTVPTPQIRASHAVEAGRRTPRRYRDTPIYVIPTGRGYRIHDGNARLGRACGRGDRTMRAWVRVN